MKQSTVIDLAARQQRVALINLGDAEHFIHGGEAGHPAVLDRYRTTVSHANLEAKDSALRHAAGEPTDRDLQIGQWTGRGGGWHVRDTEDRPGGQDRGGNQDSGGGTGSGALHHRCSLLVWVQY